LQNSKKNRNFAPDFETISKMTIKLKKGLDIPLEGKSDAVVRDCVQSSDYTIYPDDFAGLTPKVAVKQGDTIKAGAPVLYDKNHPDVKIVSPVGGEIVAVNRGEKRRLLSVVIQAKNSDSITLSDTITSQTITSTSLAARLANAGLFAFIRQRPYDIIANPADAPRDIFVTGFSSAPLAPAPDVLIKGNEDFFQIGLETLRELTHGNVYVGISADTKSETLKNAATLVFDGPHPAGNVGVQINHIKPVNKGETVWTLDLMGVVYIGRFMKTGVADFRRLVALTGSEVKYPDRAYYECLPGVALGEFLKDKINGYEENTRIISGNVLTGVKTGFDGSLHYADTQITAIPEGCDRNDFLGWISPGLTKYSVASSFASRFLDVFKRKNYRLDARILGGKRAMIMSEEFDRVFPMDILPEYLLRAIIAFDIEKMENLGIYEVAPEDFALCEFVDTSKMELQQIVRDGLDRLYKEMS
jgi:Na+-transporting NADH:ubiquinone oxidoreductase subunit A